MMYRQAQTTDTLIIEPPEAIDESKVIAINSRTAAIVTGGVFPSFGQTAPVCDQCGAV